MHFNRKLNGVRQKWPYNVSHLVLIGMRRQSKPDKRLPEWEEIRYVIRYLKNSWRILIKNKNLTLTEAICFPTGSPLEIHEELLENSELKHRSLSWFSDRNTAQNFLGIL